MLNLLRPLYESWLLEASQGPLSAWKRALLARALQHDEALRCLALELSEFCAEEMVPTDAPDMSQRLKAHAKIDLAAEEEGSLYPSAWIPVAALAILLLVALAVLWSPGAPELPTDAAHRPGVELQKP